MKPKEQRQDQWKSFLGDCTLEDVSSLLISSPAALRQTTVLTGKMCACVFKWRKMNVLGQNCPRQILQSHICVQVNQTRKTGNTHFILNAHACIESALSYNHVSLLLGKKYLLPAPALFRPKQPPIPQAVYLREKRACSYVNICLWMCVRKRRVMMMQSGCDTWVHSTLPRTARSAPIQQKKRLDK